MPTHRGPQTMIRVVTVRDDRIEAVVAATHLDHEQHIAGVDARSERRQRLCACCAREKRRHATADDGDAE